jgi:hypothetical protein
MGTYHSQLMTKKPLCVLGDDEYNDCQTCNGGGRPIPPNLNVIERIRLRIAFDEDFPYHSVFALMRVISADGKSDREYHFKMHVTSQENNYKEMNRVYWYLDYDGPVNAAKFIDAGVGNIVISFYTIESTEFFCKRKWLNFAMTDGKDRDQLHSVGDLFIDFSA